MTARTNCGIYEIQMIYGQSTNPRIAKRLRCNAVHYILCLMLTTSGIFAQQAVSIGPNATTGAVPPNEAGSPEAAVTLEEFAAFQCPVCAAKNPVVNEVVAFYGNRIHFVFRHSPFDIPPMDKAYDAALATEAARKQGKFWDMVNLLFANQDSWAYEPDYKVIWNRYARQTGLRVSRFQADLADVSSRERVDADIRRAKSIGVKVVPSFYLNGVLIESERITVAGLKQIIEAELLKNSTGKSMATTQVSKRVTALGYIDVTGKVSTGCTVRIISGEKVYIGIVSYEQLSALTGRRVNSYEEAVQALDGEEINSTLIVDSSCEIAPSCTFRSVSQLGFPKQRRNQSNLPLKQRQTSTETIVDLSTDILFDFDKATVNSEAIPSLIKLVRLVRQSTSRSIQLNGFTDSVGNDAYNVGLSQRRADAVKLWLVSKGGIEGSRLLTTGYGKAQPVAPNELDNGADNPGGRRKNRRVEVRIPIR